MAAQHGGSKGGKHDKGHQHGHLQGTPGRVVPTNGGNVER